jgi:hypothetical protein
VSDPNNAGTPTGWVQFKIVNTSTGASTTSPFVPLDPAGNASYTATPTVVAVYNVFVYYYGDQTYATADNTQAPWKQDVTSTPPSGLSASVTSNTTGPGFTLTVNALLSDFVHIDTTYNGTAIVTVTSAPAGGNIVSGTNTTGTFSGAFVSGVAHFKNLTATVDGTYTLHIVTGNLSYDLTFTTNGGRIS